MPDTRDPIQELVSTARRKQILDAATQVFAEKGFHRATIKDIARIAGIADGTIYTYFARQGRCKSAMSPLPFVQLQEHSLASSYFNCSVTR